MTLLSFILIFGAALIACLLLTPMVRYVALRAGLVDEPDGRRKIHTRPIPVAGGVAVILASAVVLSVAFSLPGTLRDTLGDHWITYAGLAVAAVVLAVLGVTDDYRGLRGSHKMLGQLVAVAIVIGCGVEVRSVRVFGHAFDFGSFAIPFTVFWLLGAINSFNLIDGMDGLLGCLGAIVCVALAGMALLNHQYQVAAIAAAAGGALAGFLCFNFPPATIFLGDCGSMIIGLVVGVLAIESSLKGPATVALAAPAALMVIPILDTSAAIVRRKLTGRSIYATDRGHLHHVLLRRGLSNRGVLLLVGSLSLTAAVGAFLSLLANSELFALVSVFIVVVVLVASRLFGQAEFLLIKERLLAVTFAVRHGHEQGRVHQSAVRLQGSTDWNDVWRHVTAFAEQMNLRAVCLDVNAPALHEAYHARWGRVPADEETPSCWRAEIPVAVHGQIVGRMEFAGAHTGEPVGETIGMVAKLVEQVELAVTGLTAPPGPSTLEEAPNSEPVGREKVSAV